MTDLDYTSEPAKYAKGMLAIRCPSWDGFKTRAARLADHLHARWSNRERAYIMSPAKAAKLERLWADGRDANAFSGTLYPEAP